MQFIFSIGLELDQQVFNCATQLRLMAAFNDLKKKKIKGSILQIVHLAHATNETFNLLVVFYLSRRRKIYI